MNSLRSGGSLYGPAAHSIAPSRVRARARSTALSKADDHRPPRWICLECRADAMTSAAGDPMRTDRVAVPTSACPGCGAQAWVDGNATAVREQIEAIDEFERSQLRRPWWRVAARGAVCVATAPVFAGTVGLVETASAASVFGALVFSVTTLLLVGVWIVTSPGYKPPHSIRRRSSD